MKNIALHKSPSLRSALALLILPSLTLAATINQTVNSTDATSAWEDMSVVIIGDSTVYNSAPRVGWGQVIPDYFQSQVTFDNRAIPGRSTKTFITEGDWASAVATLQVGDYVLIQFGHNDSHDPADPESTDAEGDYKTYLQQYIDETRAVGATPILVTPMHRRSFDAEGNLLSYYLDGSNTPTSDLAPYAAAMRAVADDNSVTCVDLFARSGELMQTIGSDACIDLLAPNDITHWNQKGAIAMASLVTRGIAESNENLKDYIREGSIQSAYSPGESAAVDSPPVSESPITADDFPLVETGTAASVVYAWNDATVVELAAGLFAEDIQRVTGILPTVTNSASGLTGPMVLIGTIGQSTEIDALIADAKIDVSAIRGGWEQYHIEVIDTPFPGVPQALVIAGSDRRGTAYGVFSISEAIGVSPWYFWADSETQSKTNLYLGTAPFTSNPPSVRYRGIFINDEDWGLQEWAEKTFENGPEEAKDLGPKTYAKIFELLLRLKANYCWPGMHPSTKAFNYYAENKVVADNYAIVMGSSHAEPMLRNNVDEWYPFASDHGYSSSWNYADNKTAIYDYWEQRAIANGGYENVFTIGKRGIHDSGMVEGSNTADKASWLNTIFTDQRTILTDHVNSDINEVAQLFVPYKEVLNIYDSGLVNVPNDVTMGWPDDNHGYIRRLSDPIERLRSGGGGVYYHISYWGDPRVATGEQADYLWLCSTPPSLIWEELTKAYAYNCNRIWVINVGDIKPGEICLEFAMRLAWDVDRFDGNAQTDWLTQWATREFGAARADEIADLLNDYYRLGYERKPEHMHWKDSDDLTPSGPYPLFSHVHYGDEADRRLGEYADLAQRASAIHASLPATQQSAFYQTVLYPILGADGMNRKFINAGKAYIAAAQGRNTVAARKTASQDGYNDILSETATYNSIENGKWNEMMNAKPRGLSVFNMPPLPSDPSLSTGTLGVAVEGQIEPAYIAASGVTYAPRSDGIRLNAATDGVLTAPMQSATIDGKEAIWTAGSDGLAYAPGDGGKAVYTFDITETGTYTLAGEVNCPTWDDDSWHIQMDGGSAVTWNNLKNDGNWSWQTFGTFELTPGTHTLTIHQREDGAAMARIKLTPNLTGVVLLEDPLQDSYMFPEFNARTRRSHFLDLFNTGTGSVSWQITPADPWVNVSRTSGSLDSEQRLWVSIDWTSAPKGASVASSLSVESAGQTLVIPITLWNPATALSASVDFVEDNGVVAIEAEHYSTLLSGSDATRWSQVSNLGSGDGAMMVSPVTAASRDNTAEIMSTSPVLEYNTYLRSAGTVTVNARFIPTLSINDFRGLRYAVSFDDETPQIVDMDRASKSSLWNRSVLRSHIDYSTTHTLQSAGAHTLKIWMVDPGVVIDHLEIATGDRPYTYRGAPETKVKSHGTLTIGNSETSNTDPGQSTRYDALTNQGTLNVWASELTIDGDIVNDGVLRFYDGARFSINGQFINNGTLDIMTWDSTLPVNFTNYGTVLDRSHVRITDINPSGNDFTLTLHGYAGHDYQLQQPVDGYLQSEWMDIGEPVPGSGTEITFHIADALSTSKQFYRVSVDP